MLFFAAGRRKGVKSIDEHFNWRLMINLYMNNNRLFENGLKGLALYMYKVGRGRTVFQ